MNVDLSPEHLALMLGLSFFFGLAFEDLYARNRPKPPGGIRTFPLLTITGALSLVLEPERKLLLVAGALVLGSWLLVYYRARLELEAKQQAPRAGLMVPVCNMLALLLGPIVLLQPTWVPVSVTVVAVLFMGARERLHGWASRVAADEIKTLAKFLILTGIILPLVPREPITELTPITPRQAWLAVVAVSTLSYASYLVQRFIAPRRGLLLAGLLGGLYSSTATTVVLSRRMRELPQSLGPLEASIVLSTAVMYLRLGIVTAIFNLGLGLRLAPFLVGLSAAGAALSWALGFRHRDQALENAQEIKPQSNPLELGTAAIFAVLFVAISIAATWVEHRYGQAGIYWLAAIVGVTDIDPFVLSMAQGGATGLTISGMASAILIAAASNNVLKAGYAVFFGGFKAGVRPAVALILLAAATALLALR